MILALATKSNMHHNKQEEYSKYVKHPRYGRKPHLTGLNPETDFSGDVFLHWHSQKDCRIANTAIVADTSKQLLATIPVSHYFDVKRCCRDCERTFIFFAQEQKFWYEVLQFGLDSDCVKCTDCRKKQHGFALKRQQYEDLFSLTDRTNIQNIEMVDCYLSLVEASVFKGCQFYKIRGHLKKISHGKSVSLKKQVSELWGRLSVLEAKGN